MTLIVSVSGVRGIVGETLTPEVALHFAQAYGTLLSGGRVVLGRDTRPSGEMFAAAVAAGLTSAGCAVTDLGVAMTPTVGRTVRAGQFTGGVMITASHNPGQWNGLKFLDDLGLAPDPGRARRIAEIRDQRNFRILRDGHHPLTLDRTAGQQHVQAVLAAIEVNTAGLRGARVVLDSINGAGALHSPSLLRALGLEVIHINGEPTGCFAHTPEPIAENLGQLGDEVRRTGAALGFAQDPDADRLAIVDEHGVFIGEEYTLALATESMLRRHPGPVAANLSTSRLIDAVAARYNVPVIRTPVGEAHVARAILDHRCVIGGEGNGGVIDPRVALVRDSLTGMSLIAQLMAATGQTISQLVAQLPRLVMIKQKFACTPQAAQRAVESAAEALADQRLNRSDGVRIDFDAGWVHLRGSNTEPIMRIIAEAITPESAQQLIDRVRRAAGL